MPDNTPAAAPRPVRDIADSYVTALADLNPFVATRLGIAPDEDRMPDLSPAGQAALDDLRRRTLAALDALPPGAAAASDDERRCARLLRERLGAALAMSEAGEHLREVSNIFGPVQRVRSIFTLMPAETGGDWAVVARRMGAVPDALAGYRESLALGAQRGLLAAPRQVSTVAVQLGQWLAAGSGAGWFAEFAAGADVPAALRTDLDAAAAGAAAAVAELRDWMTADYLPRAAGTPDGMGEERYRRSARLWTGADLDLAEIQEWGWSEYHRIRGEMQDEARRVLPGATPAEAMRYLDEHSAAVDGVPQV
jgi:uncharacterized protein (DUF885 family)